MKMRFAIFVSAALALAHAHGADEFSLISFTADGGGGLQQGGEFSLVGTVGQSEASPVIGDGDFRLEGGFWPFEGPTAPPSPPALLLRVRLTSSGRIEISAEAPPGLDAIVQATTDPGNASGWMDLGNVTADAGGVMTFVSTDNPTYPMRFYRFVSTLHLNTQQVSP